MKIQKTWLHFSSHQCVKTHYLETNCLIKGFVMRCTACVNPNNNYVKTVHVNDFVRLTVLRVLTRFQKDCLRLTFSSFVSFFHNFITHTIQPLPKRFHNVSIPLCVTDCFYPFILSRALSAFAIIFAPTHQVLTNTVQCFLHIFYKNMAGSKAKLSSTDSMCKHSVNYNK